MAIYLTICYFLEIIVIIIIVLFFFQWFFLMLRLKFFFIGSIIQRVIISWVFFFLHLRNKNESSGSSRHWDCNDDDDDDAFILYAIWKNFLCTCVIRQSNRSIGHHAGVQHLCTKKKMCVCVCALLSMKIKLNRIEFDPSHLFLNNKNKAVIFLPISGWWW